MRLYCQRDIETNPNKALIVTCVSERTLTEVLCSVNNAPFKPCEHYIAINNFHCFLQTPIVAGTLPWRVDISSSKIREYHLQINVTDSLNLTDSDTIEYEGIKSTMQFVVYYAQLSPFLVGPLSLRCSFNAELEIECLSNNQLAPNTTVCSFNGVTTNPCMYNYRYILCDSYLFRICKSLQDERVHIALVKFVAFVSGTLPHGIDVTGLPAGVYSGLVEATDTFGSSASSTIEYQGRAL